MTDALTLLSGDAHAFVEKVWASRPQVHRVDPADLAALLSLDDVDTLLTSTALRTPSLRLARDGQVLARSRYTRSATLAGVALTGLVDARKVFDLFDEGATVVLQGLHRYWPPLRDLTRELELALGHPCQANAYLTPPGAQGFALHRDTHDVFVLQTHGSKLWEIHDQDGRHEVSVEAGTSMYLPAGTPHAARTQQASSLHVTVGINQVTWRQVMERLWRRMPVAAELDHAIPAGYLADPRVLAAGLGERLSALADAMTVVDLADAADAEVRHFATTRPPLLAGGIRDRLAMADLTDDTDVVRRPGSICVLQPSGQRLRVLLGDRELLVPARLAEPLAHVREHSPLRPADLAGWLDAESRLVLVRRLVREGLLQVQG